MSDDITLPTLPKHWNARNQEPMYTADQMHAYVLADRAARTQQQAEPTVTDAMVGAALEAGDAYSYANVNGRLDRKAHMRAALVAAMKAAPAKEGA